MTLKILTQEHLKEILYYEPDSGLFTWLRGNKKIRMGAIAGTINNKGYIIIGINGRKYQAHRLAFLYINGEFPPDQVDHINRKRTDNRWSNIRHADRKINSHNRSDNAAFIGVNWHKRKMKWMVYSPRINGRNSYLGCFITHLAACYARHSYDVCHEENLE